MDQVEDAAIRMLNEINETNMLRQNMFAQDYFYMI